MTRRWQVAVVLLAVGAACGAPARPPAPAPIASRAPPASTPAALRDDAEQVVLARARVARLGATRFERADPPIERDGGSDEVPAEVHVVADQSDARVQIRTDGDDAHLLLWVDRADLATVVVKAQALVDPATGRRGAVARPGAIAKIVSTSGDAREVVVEDGAVRASGRVPAPVLGNVYDQRPPRTVDAPDAIAEGQRVQAAPGPGAAVIAEVTSSVSAKVLAPPKDGWVEIEIDREWIYVRGFIPSEGLLPHGFGTGESVGTGGYGMSDTATLILPSGACLYARPGGPVIGINTAERLRYANDAGEPGWRRIAVDTAWGMVWPAVHFPEQRGVPAGDFDHCATN